MSEWAVGNIYVRENLGNQGDVVDGHSHNFDHCTMCMRGAIRVKRKDTGRTVVLRAASGDSLVRRSALLIEAGVEHEIEFLEDGSVFWCVYSHRNPQGEIVQTYTGWEAANT